MNLILLVMINSLKIIWLMDLKGLRQVQQPVLGEL
nr:MAG TPA: hypothetical protein [Caudoviricetes sp.]